MSESVPSPQPDVASAPGGVTAASARRSLTAVGAAARGRRGRRRPRHLRARRLGGDAARTSTPGNIAGIAAVADMQNALDDTRIAARNAILTPADADGTKVADTSIPEHAQTFHAAADGLRGSRTRRRRSRRWSTQAVDGLRPVRATRPRPSWRRWRCTWTTPAGRRRTRPRRPRSATAVDDSVSEAARARGRRTPPRTPRPPRPSTSSSAWSRS